MDDKLRQLQLAELRILDEFIRVCEAHSLQYYLTGGTLLGAVRHQGFIPWDDDIDVAMPRADYLQLLTLQDEFLPDFRLDAEELNADCPYNYCKLYDRTAVFDPLPGYGPPEVYIDIFPYYPSRFPGKRAKLCMNMISVIGYVLQVKCGWDEYVPYKKRTAAWAYTAFSGLPGSLLRALRRRFTGWLTVEGTGYSFSPGGKHGETEIIPSDWLADTQTAEFENRSCAVPVEWDAFLKQYYGDYQVLPAEEERERKHRGCRQVQ